MLNYCANRYKVSGIHLKFCLALTLPFLLIFAEKYCYITAIKAITASELNHL